MRSGEVGEGGPIRLVLEVGRDVVEQQTEGPHPEGRNRRELRRKRLDVARVRVADGQSRAEAVHELDAVRGAALDQLREPLQVVARVRLAPGASHERVVLGGVDERVHLVRGKELDELEPLLASPRVAVEPFDDATDGKWSCGAVSDHRPLPCDWYRAFAASPPSTLLLV